MTDSTPQSQTPNAVAEELSRVFALGPGALAQKMGIEITHADADRVEASMPVEGNTQPYGLLHGGASVVLAETVGSIAAALHAGPQRAAVGVDISATHHRAGRTGHVHAVATPLHRGRTTASYDIVITDDAGKRVCTSRLTCSLLSAPKG
ncbi:PaaI family thioesterase [Kytococcus sp. HMSC28H12]|uniref:PaaI family thioesterase n=1 Tax=Kytococcus TaxID=57499 RepID=UPI0008A194D8|nr:aromatic compound degradation protein PaaI [Kytococcus sp. HMSC28H12]